MNDTLWMPLKHYRVMVLEGQDAAAFLHGQCTHDVTALEDGQANYGSHCNPKGRMISNFLNARLAASQFALRLREDIEPLAYKAFEKYLVFSNAQFHDEANLSCFAILGTRAPAILKKLRALNLIRFSYQHDLTCIEFWSHKGQASELAQHIDASSIESEEKWEHEMISRGIVDLNAESSELFLPQELNLDRYNAVSFQKGCYTGQEVIARLHYRGKLKKHTYWGRCQTSVDVNACRLVDASSGDVCGTLLCHSANNGHLDFLALCSDDVIKKNSVVLSHSTDTAMESVQHHNIIEWQTLPYAIP